MIYVSFIEQYNIDLLYDDKYKDMNEDVFFNNISRLNENTTLVKEIQIRTCDDNKALTKQQIKIRDEWREKYLYTNEKYKEIRREEERRQLEAFNNMMMGKNKKYEKMVDTYYKDV